MKYRIADWNALQKATENLGGTLNLLRTAVEAADENAQLITEGLLADASATIRASLAACASSEGALLARQRLDAPVAAAKERAAEHEAAQKSAEGEPTTGETTSIETNTAAASDPKAISSSLVTSRTDACRSALHSMGSALTSGWSAVEIVGAAVKRLPEGDFRERLSHSYVTAEEGVTNLRRMLKERLVLERSLSDLLGVAGRDDETVLWFPVDPEMAMIRDSGMTPKAFMPLSSSADEPVKPEYESLGVLVRRLLAHLAKEKS